MTYLDINRVPDLVKVQLASGWTALHKQGTARWQSTSQDGIEVTTQVSATEQQVRLSAPGVGVYTLVLRWQQHVPGNLRVLGDEWERGYGTMEWRGPVPERPLPWYFLTYDQQRTHAYGVKTGAAAFCFWQLDPQGVSLWIDVRNGGSGVELGTRELLAASIVTREGTADETPFRAAQAFCRILCAKPLLPAHPVYGGNNWYYAYGRSSHQEILDDSRLIASLAPDGENRPYMVIDDGWQLCHISSCNGGPWRYGNSAFPDMGKLAQQMREIGVRPGIWFRPLLTLEKVPESWLSPKQRFKDDITGQILDPSVPDVLAHIQGDIHCLRQWGFELIKHDFSTFDIFGTWGFQMRTHLTAPGWHFADRTRTTAEIILNFYQRIAEAAGDALVLGCNTVGHLAAGIFALQRTGDDTSGTHWERTRKMGINTLAFRMPQHNTFFAVDADCVGLTEHVPWELNRQWLDLLARSGTPLFVSAAPDAIGPAQTEALRAAFRLAAQSRPPAEPLDWLDTPCPTTWRIDEETVHFSWYEPDGIHFS